MDIPEQFLSSSFVGREALLQSLHDMLSSTRVAMLTGTPGSGKTALAREYARRFAREYRDVLWLDAGLPESLQADALSLSRRVPLSTEATEALQQGLAGIGKLIEEWTGKLEDVLFVLDNVLYQDAPLAQEQHPPRGLLLLVSHNDQPAPATHRLAVKPLDAHEGALLVLRCLPQDSAPVSTHSEHTQRAQELARELAGSPLALTLAGGYLKATACNVQDYLFAYRDFPERPESATDRNVQILETVCDLTLARLAQSQPIARRLLQLCAFLSSCPLPRVLFRQENLQATLFRENTDEPEQQLNEAIKTLSMYGLLDFNAKEDTLSIHPLLQTVIQQTLPQEQQGILREQLLIACLRLALTEEKDSMDEKEHPGEFAVRALWLVGHIRMLAIGNADMPLQSEEAADAYAWAASQLGEQGLVQEAEALLQKALRGWERSTGDSTPRVADALLPLAIFNARLQRYDKAEEYAQQAINLTSQISGISHFKVLVGLKALAEIYQREDKFKEASSCYQEMISIGKRVGLQKHSLYFDAWRGLLKLGAAGQSFIQ